MPYSDRRVGGNLHKGYIIYTAPFTKGIIIKGIKRQNTKVKSWKSTSNKINKNKNKKECNCNDKGFLTFVQNEAVCFYFGIQ